MVLAKTSKAARRISQQFRDRTIKKLYYALVAGTPPESGGLVDELIRDRAITRVALPGEKGTKASLNFKVIGQGEFNGGLATLLAIQLLTGFKHQIRCQLANLGFPIIGDVKYGGRQGATGVIGLWAYELTLSHPISQEPLTFTEKPGVFWPWPQLRPRGV
jgi:23S rRNA pseudouridine1911/1915/1917 synthase